MGENLIQGGKTLTYDRSYERRVENRVRTLRKRSLRMRGAKTQFAIRANYREDASEHDFEEWVTKICSTHTVPSGATIDAGAYA